MNGGMLNPELEHTLEAAGLDAGRLVRKIAPDAPTLSTQGGNHPPDAGGYPPKPKNWHPGRAGAGECGKCGAWWQGWDTAHCPTCHRMFTTITAFDKHRAGSHAYDTRHCVDPATVLNQKGERVLIDAGRDYPCWGFPAGEKWWNEDDGAS